MSRKSVLYNYPLIPPATTVGDGDYTTPVVTLTMQDNVCIMVNITQTTQGASTMAVEASNDDGVTWYALDFGATPNISVVREDMYVLTCVPFTSLRVKITGGDDASVLVMGITLTAKSVGA